MTKVWILVVVMGGGVPANDSLHSTVPMTINACLTAAFVVAEGQSDRLRNIRNAFCLNIETGARRE